VRSGREIAIGSRGSALALAQATMVADALQRQGRPNRIVVIQTDGDRRAPDTAWGEGAFVAAIERALLDGRVDLAVHSAKDVPTDEDPRLRIGAYLPRADPRDALVLRADATARRLDDLAPGTRVGTDSPRRTGFLLARHPDLIVHPLHGNVDTRLRRLDTGETDALVLACAGLDRMGLGHRIVERLEPETVLPAPGQGAIALQIRADDARTLEVVATIDDRPTRLAVEAERAFLSESGGGCRAPIGALATVSGDEIELIGGYADPDGSVTAVARRRGPSSAGKELARELATALDAGTRVRMMASSVEPPASPAGAPRVLVTRAAQQADELTSALRENGLDPIRVPAISVELEPPGGELDAAMRGLDTYRWVVVTSANGARAILRASERVFAALETPRWAAIGRATRAILEHEGITIDLQPARASGAALADELPIEPGDRVLLVRGDLADAELPAALRARGAVVDEVVAYRTREAPEGSRALLRRAMDGGPIDAVVFTSGSTVRGLLRLARMESLDVASIPSVCIGPETAAEATDAGFSVIAVSVSQESSVLAITTARTLAAHPGEIR
jgi:hydroxymethylbilane synthase